MGLGGWPTVSLAKARERAFANRIAVAEGRDPLAVKRLAKVPTFREAAQKTYEANRSRWRSAKVAATWLQQMERHAFGRLADMPVGRIGREDVLSVLTPIWTSRPEVARKLRRRLQATLRWAMAHGYVEQNVAGEAISGALPSMTAVRQHYRALPYRDIPGALLDIEASQASLAAKFCLRFLILTAARSGEARGATWDEINPGAREWRIPPERMKAGAGIACRCLAQRVACSSKRGFCGMHRTWCFRRR